MLGYTMSNCGTLRSKVEKTLYLYEILFATLQSYVLEESICFGGINLLALTCYLTNNTGHLLGLVFLAQVSFQTQNMPYQCPLKFLQVILSP